MVLAHGKQIKEMKEKVHTHRDEGSGMNTTWLSWMECIKLKEMELPKISAPYGSKDNLTHPRRGQGCYFYFIGKETETQKLNLLVQGPWMVTEGTGYKIQLSRASHFLTTVLTNFLPNIS